MEEGEEKFGNDGASDDAGDMALKATINNIVENTLEETQTPVPNESSVVTSQQITSLSDEDNLKSATESQEILECPGEAEKGFKDTYEPNIRSSSRTSAEGEEDSKSDNESLATSERPEKTEEGSKGTSVLNLESSICTHEVTSPPSQKEQSFNLDKESEDTVVEEEVSVEIPSANLESSLVVSETSAHLPPKSNGSPTVVRGPITSETTDKEEPSTSHSVVENSFESELASANNDEEPNSSNTILENSFESESSSADNDGISNSKTVPEKSFESEPVSDDNDFERSASSTVLEKSIQSDAAYDFPDKEPSTSNVVQKAAFESDPASDFNDKEPSSSNIVPEASSESEAASNKDNEEPSTSNIVQMASSESEAASNKDNEEPSSSNIVQKASSESEAASNKDNEEPSTSNIVQKAAVESEAAPSKDDDDPRTSNTVECEPATDRKDDEENIIPMETEQESVNQVNTAAADNTTTTTAFNNDASDSYITAHVNSKVVEYNVNDEGNCLTPWKKKDKKTVKSGEVDNNLVSAETEPKNVDKNQYSPRKRHLTTAPKTIDASEPSPDSESHKQIELPPSKKRMVRAVNGKSKARNNVNGTDKKRRGRPPRDKPAISTFSPSTISPSIPPDVQSAILPANPPYSPMTGQATISTPDSSQDQGDEVLFFIPEGWRFYASKRELGSFAGKFDMYYVTLPPVEKIRSRVELLTYMQKKNLSYDPQLFFRRYEIEPALKKGILKYYDSKTVIPASETEPLKNFRHTPHQPNQQPSKKIYFFKSARSRKEQLKKVRAKTEQFKKQQSKKEQFKKQQPKKDFAKKEPPKQEEPVRMKKMGRPPKDKTAASVKGKESSTVQEIQNVSGRERRITTTKKTSITSVSEKESIPLKEKQVIVRTTRNSLSALEEIPTVPEMRQTKSPKLLKRQRGRRSSPSMPGGRQTRSSMPGTPPLSSVKEETSADNPEVPPEERVKIQSKPKIFKSPYFSSNVLGCEQPKSPAGLRKDKTNCEAPPRSPFNLIQEDLFHDPWQMLIATIFLNSTSGKVAIPLALEFLKRWPTPQAACQAKLYDVLDVIEPLGFGRTRVAIIIRFSHEFMTKDWKLPNELYGIGKYGTDSYKIFCMKDEWKRVDSDDPMLMMYLNWRRATEHLRKKFLKIADNPTSIDPDDISPIPLPTNSNGSIVLSSTSTGMNKIPPSKKFGASESTPPKKRLRSRTACK